MEIECVTINTAQFLNKLQLQLQLNIVLPQ